MFSKKEWQNRIKQPMPEALNEWIDDINLAIMDAKETKPFGLLTGHPITKANLFHLAPMVCMKFRGFDFRDEKLRTKVVEGALATYVANSDPDGNDCHLEARPLMAFALCYVAAHYVLDLVDETEAQSILEAYEKHLSDAR